MGEGEPMRLRAVLLGVWTLLMVTLAVVWVSFPRDALDSTLGVLIAAVTWVVVGAVLTYKVPSNSVGILALVAGSAWVLYLFGRGYGSASLGADGGYPGAYLFAWVGAWTGALLPIGVSLLILVYPTGRPKGRWRLLAIPPLAAVLSTIAGAVTLWGVPLPILIDDQAVSAVESYVLVDMGFIVGFVSAVPAALSVVMRFRRAGSVERLQIKWLLAAACLFAAVYLVGVVTDDSNEAAWWLLSGALAAIPLAIIFAVLRYRLYDIDRILSRTISYVIVLAVLGGVYAAGLSLMTSLLPSDSPLAVAASTLTAAALFNPLRRRVQHWVDRRFNRSRYDAQRVVDTFAGSLREDLDPDAVVTGWVSVVSETMQPDAVSVWVRNDLGTQAT